MRIRLPTNPAWINISDLISIEDSVDIQVRNYCTQTIYVIESAIPPTGDFTTGYPVLPNESVILEHKNDIWVWGEDGFIWVEDANTTPTRIATLTNLPDDLYTDPVARRIRVDVGQTGFFAGREFRSYYEMNIAGGSTVNLLFTSPVNFILWEQTLSLDAGGRRATVHVGATPTGTWTPLPVIGRNRMTDRPQPYYQPVSSLSFGGGFTGGTVVEVIRARTGSNQGNNRSSTVGTRQSDERGLPAGDYIISLSPMTGVTDAAEGLYLIEWEERP